MSIWLGTHRVQTCICPPVGAPFLNISADWQDREERRKRTSGFIQATGCHEAEEKALADLRRRNGPKNRSTRQFASFSKLRTRVQEVRPVLRLHQQCAKIHLQRQMRFDKPEPVYTKKPQNARWLVPLMICCDQAGSIRSPKPNSAFGLSKTGVARQRIIRRCCPNQFAYLYPQNGSTTMSRQTRYGLKGLITQVSVTPPRARGGALSAVVTTPTPIPRQPLRKDIPPLYGPI